MHIEKGRDRIVICIPILGIVLKIGRLPSVVYIAKVIWQVCTTLLRKPSWQKLKDGCEYIASAFYSEGWRANWLEYYTWRRTRSCFLEPTYLSIGFVNIQKYGVRHPPIESDELFGILFKLADQSQLLAGHHLVNPQNYSYRDGKLRLVDYGSERLERFIVEHGRNIHEQFKVS